MLLWQPGPGPLDAQLAGVCRASPAPYQAARQLPLRRLCPTIIYGPAVPAEVTRALVGARVRPSLAIDFGGGMARELVEPRTAARD